MRVGDNLNLLSGEVFSTVLFFVAFYGLMARRNILKSIICLTLMESAVVIFFITMHASAAALPPVRGSDPALMADPLPQALMITAIVIGVCTTAVNLTLFISLYHRHKTTNWDKAKSQK
jgi:multicomponent Na+:H+ antiporter subunit C